MTKTVRIGTRKSDLSLWQANHIAALIRRFRPTFQTELCYYQTRGDLNQSDPLPAIGGKGVFTEALEAALRRHEIDCAVHSLKDLPVANAAGVAIGAIMKRGDHRDVLVSRTGLKLAQLPAGSRIGTSSTRRRSQLLALRPDLDVRDIRGNVPTRLAKLMAADAQYDAIVLAAAGLIRLGLADHISEIFKGDQMLCAPGQGAIALQCRADETALAFFAPLADPHTTVATTAERAFLHELGAGCSTPVAAYAHVADGALHLQGRVIAPHGGRQIDVNRVAKVSRESEAVNVARQLGIDLARAALAKGAHQLLRDNSDDASPGNDG